MDFKKFLSEKSLGQTEFSKRTGVPLRTVQNWYSGKNASNDWTMRMIALYIDNIENPDVKK